MTSYSSILVIGGGGFVGCILSNGMSRQGYRVSAIDLPERRPAGLGAAVDYQRADMLGVVLCGIFLKIDNIYGITPPL